MGCCAEYAVPFLTVQAVNFYIRSCTYAAAPSWLRPQHARVIRRFLGCMSYADGSAGVTEGKTPRLLDQVCARLRLKHYSLRTESAYVGSMLRFILANAKHYPGICVRLAANNQRGRTQ